MADPAPPPVRVLINALHSKSGGGVTYLNNILPRLAADPRFELHLALHRGQLELFEPLADHARLHIFDFRPGLARTVMWDQLVLPLAARMMSADLVYSPANYGPLLSGASVVLVRNALAVATQEARLGKILYWVVVAGMTWLSLLTARRAVAVSDYTVRSLTRWPFGRLRRKMTVVHHGVSDVFRPDPATPRDDVLFAVGDLYIQKNYHTLIEAFAGLAARRPGLRLEIAGQPLDPAYAARLARRVEELGLGGRVAFLGHVPPAALADRYRRCRLFVFPSTVETFGNPLVEAMACGTPIACSDRTAMPEIAGDAVVYFDPADSASIAGAVDRLLDDEPLRDRMAARPGERARAISWESNARQLADILVGAARRA